MHLLTTSSTNLDEIVEAVDLGQTPGEIAVLSFADSDLAGLAAAWERERADLPRVRLAHLRDLRHPMSVDLWIDRVGTHAKVIVVRLLGGLDWWKYGVERLAALTRERGIALAVLPGEDRDDKRLQAASTIPHDELEALLQYFREGGLDNMGRLLRRLGRHAGFTLELAEPATVPRLAGYLPGEGAVTLDRLIATLAPDKPAIPIIFYRALLLAADTAPVDALSAALADRGLAPAPLVITSLKDREADSFLRHAFARLDPALIVTTTAFAAGGNAKEPTALEAAGVTVLQAISAATKRAAWHDSPRGLGASDLAMHVVLPELDGRVLAGAIAFKDPLPRQDGLAFTALTSRPEPDRIAMVANRIAAMVRLRGLPRGKRRVAVLMPDYPGAKGRTGYAVGLDAPASVLAAIEDLAEAGYAVNDAPKTSRELLDALVHGAGASLSLAQYENLATRLPPAAVACMGEAWGEPASDPEIRNGAFHFRAQKFGNVLVALPPDRGRSTARRADYHDPLLPPRHALVAFGLWLQHVAKVDALVHMGAHGTLEWLPGKAIALTAECFPEIVTGALPVIYPFIVSNPGEAAQAKRRIAGVTIGHLPPPLVAGGPSGDAHDLELLLDEYAQAEGLDRRRRERLAKLIVETAERSGLAREAGAGGTVAPDEALRRIDAWLCDLKDLAVKDGQHIYGRVAAGVDDPA
ncbi:MAG: cobaltochelatase subunit CobN, partial [Xanthobacteraceae bacterium]